MSVPSVLNFEQTREKSDMNVDTSILDPVINTATNCRFVIPNKGILHSKTTMINIGVKCTGEGANKHTVFLPLVNGVYSMIDRAVLKIGTKIIGEIKDLNYWMSYYSGLLHPRVVRQEEQVLTGRGLAYGVTPYATSDTSQFANLNNGYSFSSFQANGMADEQTDDFDYFVPDYNNMLNTTDNITQYQISLKELFPILDSYMLPLYLMKEQISIELFYTKNADHTCIDTLENTTKTAVVAIDQPSIFMVIDYIYYNEAKMMMLRESFLGSEAGAMPYTEQQLVTSSIPNDASGLAFNRNMGGAGRLVEKLMSMNNPIKTDDQKMNSVLNAYDSTCPDPFTLTYNLVYNDERLFPINVSNIAHVASNLKYAERMPLYVPVSQFNNNVMGGAVQNVSGLPVADMDGERFYITTLLQKNRRINSRGIQMQQNASFNTVPVINRSWMEIHKMYVLDRNGYVEINYV